MEPKTAEKVQAAIEVAKTVFKWTYIPALIYFGLNTGPAPRPTLADVFTLGA
ncbi:hypothetical protein PTSG_12160 [Salpingoeca rosetta]|uniref:Uncharacterized protein n=1 Tax=Salpingoeca rosetta (strain ATCC 50818 / BSB-021) TaxID=946362 RepID=F2U8B0_SALR5|nr:uncharacterized protein PTSG_12160 [Salpingoeca rosetta]EGD72618.1 hypothetical protein PTSG_12160 [Salpingoeca rosetta]|eukprot:XP_004994441.1 hypothetical protein PTSG_12160 [Salpingoeca rosetta]